MTSGLRSIIIETGTSMSSGDQITFSLFFYCVLADVAILNPVSALFSHVDIVAPRAC